MGQPKFPRKNYDTPSHPWQGDRIKAENEVKGKFGLKNKREIWKAQTRLREIRGQARGLISRTRNPQDEQAAIESKLLLQRLYRQGYVGDEAGLNDVLGLDVERILNRRLQSQVYLKGLARTPQQARQFISHGCILVGDRRVTVPSYVVRRTEEEQIHIDPAKSLADDDHPVRPKAVGFEAVQEMQAREAAASPVAQTQSEAAADTHVKTDAPAKAEARGTEGSGPEGPAAPEAKPDATEGPAAETEARADGPTSDAAADRKEGEA